MEARFAEAKKITIKEDSTLPPTTVVEIGDAKKHIGKRVEIKAWVHTIRTQGKEMKFLVLRDGTGYPGVLQAVLSGKMAQTFEAVTLHREAAVSVKGKLVADARAEGGVELQADYWELVGPSDGEIENRFNDESKEDVLADQRHLQLRKLKPIYIMKLRSMVTQCFRQHFFDKGFVEVTPPTIVQTQVEGGSTLFKFDYFGDPAYLTQSSQLYLETVVPSLKKVFCVLPSFRAEPSRTRRHLAEFTHFEGEIGFITYEQLLETLEDMVVDVAERLVKVAGEMLKDLNPEFKPPQKPFLRMDYSEAVKYCNEHNIYKDEKTKEHFKFGDDITEAPERKMTDKIGKPIFLMRFPAAMKSFYMQRCGPDDTLTESVDLLMPGVGEIIGGSMRSWKLDKLMDGFTHEGISADPYYWYTDLRKFGSCQHGGWGLGLERYLCWKIGRAVQQECRDRSRMPSSA
eukprot:TRINITY_DN8151_c0_g1_i7.p1 TRINITY_DN8151_c0_g1~~TRINITY_DN8151_c0_g1_i7.p1  ORF type:complete len:457 (+),score=75.83 TRINITY_DN8151_c0_g1_i7:53-1423(+)